MSTNNSVFPIQLLIMLQTEIEFKILIERRGKKTSPPVIFLFHDLCYQKHIRGMKCNIPSLLPISSQENELLSLVRKRREEESKTVYLFQK